MKDMQQIFRINLYQFSDEAGQVYGLIQYRNSLNQDNVSLNGKIRHLIQQIYNLFRLIKLNILLSEIYLKHSINLQFLQILKSLTAINNLSIQNKIKLSAMEEQINQMKSSIYNIQRTLQKFNSSIPTKSTQNILPDSLIKQQAEENPTINNLGLNKLKKKDNISHDVPYHKYVANSPHNNTQQIKIQNQTKGSSITATKHKTQNNYIQSNQQKLQNPQKHHLSSIPGSLNYYKCKKKQNKKGKVHRKKTSSKCSFTVKTTFIYNNQNSLSKRNKSSQIAQNPQKQILYVPPGNKWEYFGNQPGNMGYLIVSQPKNSYQTKKQQNNQKKKKTVKFIDSVDPENKSIEQYFPKSGLDKDIYMASHNEYFYNPPFDAKIHTPKSTLTQMPSTATKPFRNSNDDKNNAQNKKQMKNFSKVSGNKQFIKEKRKNSGKQKKHCKCQSNLNVDNKIGKVLNPFYQPQRAEFSNYILQNHYLSSVKRSFRNKDYQDLEDNSEFSDFQFQSPKF